MTDISLEVRRQLKFLAFTFLALFAAAMVAIIAAGAGYHTGVFGVGMCIVLASTTIGGLIGFLFSVPRVFARPEAATSADQGETPEPGRRLLQTNTNLERISDWLTTMLVGVGLSQVGNVNAGLLAFRSYIAEYAAATPAQANALAIISPLLLLFGLVGGLLATYVYTRVVLVTILNDVEMRIRRLPEPVQEAVTGVARQAQADGVSSAAIAAAADPNTPVTAEGSVRMMFDLLYEPEGYKRVIELGDELAGTAASNLVTYHFYLAAAYGQQLAAARAEGDERAAVTARERALAAVRRAIQLSPSYRNRLWYISNPDSVDNDLASLRDDPEFRNLVGR